jgi:putative tributyrin esterase
VRRILLLAVAAAACFTAAPGERNRSFRAPSLPGREPYSVFLPPSYSRSPGRSYPVLYFLHDVFGDHDVLFREGAAARVRRAMERGEISEFLIVCPEGKKYWFSNARDGRHLYETLLARDLPREIERRYRVRPGAANRAITGISMGGYGAVKTALKHPDLYGSVSSLSGAVMPLNWEQVERLFLLARWQIHRVFGDSPKDNTLAENDIWRIVQSRPRWDLPFDVYLLAGTEDKYGLDRVAIQLADVMNRHGIRAFAKTEPGTHDWSYWSRAFLEIARWHGKRFGGGVRSEE